MLASVYIILVMNSFLHGE